MPETTIDHVSIRIDEILLALPSTPLKPTIFRVDEDLRCFDDKIYDPRVISIGPYHHSRGHLQKMEENKFRYLKNLLKRKNESSVDKYIMAIRPLEERARKCYAESINFSRDKFVEMLLLDAFFVVELIRKYTFDKLKESDDTIFQHHQVLGQLRHDLMLVENQIPFFVLDQLFNMTRTGNPEDEICYLIRLFIDDISPWPGISEIPGKLSVKNVDHLLCLVHKMWCSSNAKMIDGKDIKTKVEEEEEEEKMVPIYSTTQLLESGIKFEKEAKNHFLDIQFNKGVMKIPCFDISDETESIFRNLIAYEHFLSNDHRKYVTDYGFFLHCLVNSSKDVKMLSRCGILTNFLCDDEMVYRMFNRLGRNVVMSSDFCYADLFDKVNRHCGFRRNKWMANLRRNYFNSPWAFMSFFAALMLLVFALTQAVFSILSYTKSK